MFPRPKDVLVAKMKRLLADSENKDQSVTSTVTLYRMRDSVRIVVGNARMQVPYGHIFPMLAHQ